MIKLKNVIIKSYLGFIDNNNNKIILFTNEKYNKILVYLFSCDILAIYC